MARIGLLSMSDGRPYVHDDTTAFVRAAEDRLCDRPGRRPAHDVVRASEPVTSNVLANRLAREVAAAGVDLTIFHYAVWAFPHFTMLAADATRSPLLLISNIDPVQPGMVGMLAAGDFQTADGKSAFNSPATVQALKFWQGPRQLVWALRRASRSAAADGTRCPISARAIARCRMSASGR